MKSISLKVVGVGGIGTWFIHAATNVVEVHAPGSVVSLYDGDNFEPKNKERQHFVKMGNKAESVAEALRGQVNSTYVMAYPVWIVSDEAAEAAVDPEDDEAGVSKLAVGDLLDEDDVVVLAVDNFAARKLVFDAAKSIDNIDIFSGGNGDLTAGDALFGNVYHYRRRNGEDVTAHPAHYHDEFVNPTDRNPGELSCAERAKLEGGSQVVAANMTVAAVILAKMSETILTEDEDIINRSLSVGEIFFDWSAGKADNAEIWPAKSDSTQNADRAAVPVTA